MNLLQRRKLGCRCLTTQQHLRIWPNKTVKWTRRPLAVLKVCFLIRFGGFVERPSAARPLPLRWASIKRFLKNMTRIEIDEDREYRIEMEVIVDAYDTEERAMGWYYYMADGCDYPFKAICIETRKISPLKIDEEVDVLSVSSAEECEKEIFVDIKWNNRNLAVPLSQLEGVDIDNKTKQVIEDWHYWCQRGYEF